jgi:hypothetical protein
MWTEETAVSTIFKFSNDTSTIGINPMVLPRARLLLESFLLGVITIPRAHGLLGVKLLEANTFLEAFLSGNLLLLGAYGFLESTHPSQKKKD